MRAAYPTPSVRPRPMASAPLPSLLGTTIRRAFIVGRVNLVIATVVSLLWGTILSLTPGSSFASLFPLLLPILGTIGTVGAMLVFTNDRAKGVFEYLIAYGVPPHRIFTNVLGAAFTMIAVVDGLTLAVALSLRVALGLAIPIAFTAAILGYSLPMSFGGSALTAAAGMFWTSLSSPRQGMNSPLGLLPLLGVAPGGLGFILAEAAGPADQAYVEVGAVSIVIVLALVLLSLESRLMPRERLLSPA